MQWGLPEIGSLRIFLGIGVMVGWPGLSHTVICTSKRQALLLDRFLLLS